MLTFDAFDDDEDIPDLPPTFNIDTYQPKPKPVPPSATPSSPERENTAPSRLPASSQNSGPATPVVGLLPNTSIEPITLTSTAEKPKPKRIAKEVARLNAARLLDSNGLPALVKIAKSINLKGKKHEFEDLQHILFQYQKWGHSVFNKFVFRSFVDASEKICRERNVKIWKESLINEERRRARGFYNDEDVLAAGNSSKDKDQEGIDKADQEAIENQFPINQALAAIDDLNREEEEEMERMIREAEQAHLQKQQSSQPAYQPNRKMVIEDEEDDFDFDSQMMAQLGSTMDSSKQQPQLQPHVQQSSIAEENLDDYEQEFNRAVAEAETECPMDEEDFDFEPLVEAKLQSSGNRTEPIASNNDQNDKGATDQVAVAQPESSASQPIHAAAGDATTLPSQAELDALAGEFEWDFE